MKLFVTGANGQLGWEVARVGSLSGHDVLAMTRSQLDITKPDDIMKIFSEFKPEIIVNGSAYTKVDQAETEKDRAYEINRDGAGHLAAVCNTLNIPLIHISTDFVFDGGKNAPYTENDPVNPLNIYGMSKWEGEKKVAAVLERHIIIRTSWLYGVHGNNFVKTMLRLAREKTHLRVVSDQTGCPTCAADLADAIVNIADAVSNDPEPAWGLYHYCGFGETTWYEFASTAIDYARKYIPVRVEAIEPISTAEYPVAAVRPSYSVLDCQSIRNTFDVDMKPWIDSLKRTIDSILTGE